MTTRKSGASTNSEVSWQTITDAHGLVVHHFVNNEGLRQVVQQHVDVLQQAVTSVPAKGRQWDKAGDANVTQTYAEYPARCLQARTAEELMSYRSPLADLALELMKTDPAPFHRLLGARQPWRRTGFSR